MNALLVVVATVLIISVLMLSININVNYDVFQNIGTVVVKVMFFTIFNSNFSVIGDYLNFSNQKSKIIKVKLDINDISIQFFSELGSYIKNKILVTKLNNNLTLCLENAFLVSIISAIINIFSNIFFTIAKNKYEDLECINYINTGYRHNILQINFTFKFIITIYDLVWSLVRTILVVRRKNEKAKNTKQKHGFN